MTVRLRIAPSVVDFIRSMFEDASEELVLVIAGAVRGTHKKLPGDDWETRPFEEILHIARTEASNLPSNVLIDYYVGTKELTRVPIEDVHVVDGIKCYLPSEIIDLLGGREIVLENRVLRIEPELAPVEITISRNKLRS